MKDEQFKEMDEKFMSQMKPLRDQRVSEGMLKGFSASVERRLTLRQETPRRSTAVSFAWAPVMAVLVIGSVAWLAFIISTVITTGVVLLLFAVIFKVLPDAELKWCDVLIGAFFTAVLFLTGQYLINFYLSHSNIVSVYGAAGAVVLIILWVYYSAIILYFGAEFTKVYANEYGGKIRPSPFAVFVERKEIVTTDPVLNTTSGPPF